MIWLALVVSIVFAAIHLFAGSLRFIKTRPRSRWLSLFGGVSVAYVFVHLLPEAEHYQARVEGIRAFAALERPIYVLALAGVIVFYGLEKWVISRSPGDRPGRGESNEGDPEPSSPGTFWLHVGSFGLYNVLICYLLVQEAEYEPGGLMMYALAMGLHYVVNDFGLREHHQQLYHRYGRWLLAGASIVGWGIGVIAGYFPIHPAVAASLFGFLCGATVLNVLKEELPAERESRFWAFAAGAAVFAVLLLVLPKGEAPHEAGSTRPATEAHG